MAQRLDIWFGEDGDEVIPSLLELFEQVVPDDKAGQRGSKKAVFMRRLLEVDLASLREVMYPEE